MGELALAAIFCSMIVNGSTEQPHAYAAGYDLHMIRVDCETETEVYEIGLDKRSSLDSLQQALFAASLTGKTPVVLIIDTDGRVDQYETRIKAAARMVGVRYETYDRDFLIRWQMTGWLRNYHPEAFAGS